MRLQASLGGLAVAQVALALLLQVVVIRGVADPLITDAWVAAQTIPLAAFALFSVALQGVWQTAFAESSGDRDRWLALQRQAIVQVLAVAGLPLALLAGSAALWLPLLFHGFAGAQLAVAIDTTRVLLAGTLANTLAAVLLTALRGHDRFVVGEAVMTASALVGLLATILVLPAHGVVGAACAYSGRLVIAAVILWLLAGAALPWKAAGSAALASSWPTLRTLLGGGLIQRLTPIVDRHFGSLAAPGGLTLFNLSQNGLQALSLVIDRAAVMPGAPALARAIKAGRGDEAHAHYRRTLRRAAIPFALSVLAVLAIRPFWVALVDVVLGLKLDSLDSWLITLVMLGFLYPASAGTIVLGAFYALDDPKTPTTIGVAGALLSIAVKALLFALHGLPGLAAAISIHYLGNFIVMHRIVDRRLRNLREPIPSNRNLPDAQL